MTDVPTIYYDEIHTDFLNSDEIRLILNSQRANLKNYRELYLSNGIIEFSDKKVNFAQNLSTIHFNIDIASKFIDIIYSISKFELGIITFIVEDNVSIEDIHNFINIREQNVILTRF